MDSDILGEVCFNDGATQRYHAGILNVNNDTHGLTSYNINMHITLKGLFRKASPSRPCARAQNVVVVNGLVIVIHFDFDVSCS